MEVAYYNEYNAVWEPLVEPVEEAAKHRPWELDIGLQTNNDILPLEDEDLSETPTLPPPKMAISLKSKDVLQTTMTKTCLEVLGNLGKVGVLV